MFLKKKKEKIVVLPTTQRQIKLIWFINQLVGLYMIDKHCKVKGVNYNFKNFYLFGTSACTFNYFPVSREFGFEAFCVWFIFDRVWNLIPKIGSTLSKGVCTVFRTYDFRKA